MTDIFLAKATWMASILQVEKKNNRSMGTVVELLECKLGGLSLKQTEVD